MTACSTDSQAPPPTVRPYGTWTSPLTAARVTAGALRLDHIVVDGADVYWVEGRAAEGGRSVVVRRTPDGRIADVTPPGFNARTRVHEYGGAAYTVHDGTVYFSNFADQRLYRQAGPAAPEPMTPAGYRYAEGMVDPARGRLIAVREQHGGGEAVNTIVAVPLDARGGDAGAVLVSGADFYSDPILSPDGARLAWLEWRHPNMPWDGTELWLADLGADGDGSVRGPTRVAGGPDESIFQPEWSPDGRLYFVSDRTGWWNLYRLADDGAAEAIHPMAAEFGKPQWTFSMRSYAFITATRIAATFSQGGRWRLALIETDPRTFEPVTLAIAPVESIRATNRELFFIGASPTEPRLIARMTLAAVEAEVLRRSSADTMDPAWISTGEAITFPSEGAEVHAFYYPPKNPDYAAPDGERPPLLVLGHGGPTGATDDGLDLAVQFWTSRGFAVVDVNYGGSTGYGRAYRDRLKGQWGVVDVADCVNAARYLVAQGKADPARLIIRGGSAGGYTALAALTFHDVFTAGASYYGISDIEVLARETHKFESRYLDSLVGPYPARRDLYVARSPLHALDRLSTPLILFQGLEDQVVPPNQSELMAEAVRRKGVPVAYVAFEGEQHGFRRAETIIRALEAELYFYGAVLGFKPADTIAPVRIDNIERAR
ncbi:MAG: prolyl oligopeptidase family serine peptidase [Acidobacteriota bacterium]